MKLTFVLSALSAFTSLALAQTDEHSDHRLLRSSQRDLADDATNSTLSFDPATTALLVIDPQNDFLHPDGVAWGVVGESVTSHNTVDNIEKLFAAAADNDFLTFVSPHYYFPHDHNWLFEGALEKLMHDINMFDRAGALNVTGFEGSGADWLDQYKPYIEADNVIITSPHKVYGPETNDLVLQMRKRKMDSVIISGMSANLCVESHMRELLEQGFEVFMVADATAAAITPDLGDGYLAAFTNFKFISSGVFMTDEVVKAMQVKDAVGVEVNKDGA